VSHTVLFINTEKFPAKNHGLFIHNHHNKAAGQGQIGLFL
jgi:hypothetical protein